ncbi:S1 RNA-binding domain-containing protein [bacterium]|nr:S1 RNA-binding domain-containing protein [bacterium]
MAEALEHAHVARVKILGIMDEAISEGRPNLSQYAPKFISIKIPIDRIGALIGPGGKMIREIISDTGATIDVEDDGTVRIGSSDQAGGDSARARVEALTQTPEEGKVYTGTVKKLMNFGAFVEILPGIEGLLHVSQIENRRVENVEDMFRVGDTVEVKLMKIDRDGKLDLSRKVLLPDYRPPSHSDRDRPRDGRPPQRSTGGGFNRPKPRNDRSGNR